ncbi:MAG: ABC transporter ATP-binding protein [Erysipelotrichaceae bacterium]|nr:ABC transporter ATP-binding protein [Erysipelotrichaceae bacterium]
MDDTLLEMKNISKIYDNGVFANDNISFIVKKGEIHALMGENGAGKSTLMKILFGIEDMNEGKIIFDGKDITNYTPQETIGIGVGMVHQHFMLVDSLKVYENVVLGMEPKKGIFTDRKKAKNLVNEISKKYNLNVDADEVIKNLSVGLKQKVELIKVLARDVKLLILDEPTAVLTPQETQELFDQLLLLKENGHTIIFISHKIKEVKQICDRVTVLRRGKLVGTIDIDKASEEDISRFMVGRDVILKVDKSIQNFKEIILSVKDLSVSNKSGIKLVDKVSFDVKRGQILGIAGVEGNGQNELVEAIFGLRDCSGTIEFNMKDISDKKIKDRREKGIAFIPEDRMATGLATKATVWENLVSNIIDSDIIKTNKLLNNNKIKEYSETLIENFNILCSSIDHEVNMLSGGNMQKIVVAREFSSNPDLLIANQPTRGIDVGANEFIWKKLVELRDQDKAIILVSADLNEILELSDSIIVMHNGEVVGSFVDSKKVDENELGMYMLGLKRD